MDTETGRVRDGADWGRIYGMLFVLVLAAAVLIGATVPRFLAYWPGLAGLAGLAAWPAVFGRWPRLPAELLFWIAAFLFLAGISSLWALDGAHALSRAGKTALILIPGAALVAVACSVPLPLVRPFLKYIVYAALGAALFCCVELADSLFLYRLVHGIDLTEVAVSSFNRNIIALLCLFFAVAGLAGSLPGRKMTAALWAAFSLMIALTQSQSAQLGFALAACAFLFFPYGRKMAWAAVAVLLAAGIIGAPFLAAWMFDHFAATVAQLPWLGRGGGFGGERLEIWDKVGRYALRSPLYGFGMEATRAITDFDTDQIYRKGVTELHPHNFAIQLWIEFGVIGACLGAGLFLRLFWRFSTLRYAQARIALPAFVALLSPAAFGYGLWQGWFVGLMILTVAFVALAVRLYGDDEV